MNFVRKRLKADAFVVNVHETGKIENLEELKKWIGNEGYFRWSVYENSEGGLIFKVFNFRKRITEFRKLENFDVLFFSQDISGDREKGQSIPIWTFGDDFNGTYERNYDA